MRVKLLQETAPRGKKTEENQVFVALEREVRVRTDLVKSVTTGPTKQVAGSGPACCSGPAAFTQMIEKKNTVSPLFPLSLPFFHSYQQAAVYN